MRAWKVQAAVSYPRHEFCFMALLVITVKCFVRRNISGWSVSPWHGVQFVYNICYKMIGCVKVGPSSANSAGKHFVILSRTLPRELVTLVQHLNDAVMISVVEPKVFGPIQFDFIS